MGLRKSESWPLTPPRQHWHRLVKRALGYSHLCYVSDSSPPFLSLPSPYLICHPSPDVNKVFRELCQGQCSHQSYYMALTPTLHFQDSNHLFSVQFSSWVSCSPLSDPFPHHSPLIALVTLESLDISNRMSPCLVSDVVNQQWPFVSCVLRYGNFLNPLGWLCGMVKFVHSNSWCMNWSLHLDSNYEQKLLQCKRNILQFIIGLWSMSWSTADHLWFGFSEHFSGLNGIHSQEVWINTAVVRTVGGWD